MHISALHFADAFQSFCSSQGHQSFSQDTYDSIFDWQAAVDTTDDTTPALQNAETEWKMPSQIPFIPNSLQNTVEKRIAPANPNIII